MAANVSIDPDLCIGAGECVRVAPLAFQIDEDLGVSVPLDPADELDQATLEQIAANCPTGAIQVLIAGVDGRTGGVR